MSNLIDYFPDEYINACMEGTRLYGDGFSPEQIAAWHEREKEGYAELGAGDRENYHYGYEALNRRHGLRYLPIKRFSHALGLGSAYGDEFAPLSGRIDRLTIVEPSKKFTNTEVHGIATTYVQPDTRGRLPFEDNSFDLISCLGVLHHIPNVSDVLGELYRVCAPGGYALIREPIVSMGDWRKPRKGLTKNERGIPLEMFKNMVSDTGFEHVNMRLCVFPPLVRMAKVVGISPFNNDYFTWVDDVYARLFSFNKKYHATHWIHKFRPTSVFFVLTKRDDD